jgi:hypothetical protein
MRDTAGNAVLGVYGGEAATYNWGGFTMASGDLVLGYNKVGSSAIWWDQSAGKFGFYGAGSATPQVEVNTDGTLYAGTAGAQRVQLSSAELAGYNSSNAKQWYGSTTDGKLYAAGGNVYLDSTGLRIKMDDTVSNGWNEVKFTSKIDANDYVNLSAYYVVGQGPVASLFSYASDAGEYGKVIISAYGYGAVGGGQIALNANVSISGNITSAVTMSSSLDVATTSRAQTLIVDGDSGGVASTVAITNGVNTTMGSGTGTIKMNGSTNRNHEGWLKFYVGATAVWLPYWVTIT